MNKSKDIWSSIGRGLFRSIPFGYLGFALFYFCHIGLNDFAFWMILIPMCIISTIVDEF
jgi:hypothetical protein